MTDQQARKPRKPCGPKPLRSLTQAEIAELRRQIARETLAEFNDWLWKKLQGK